MATNSAQSIAEFEQSTRSGDDLSETRACLICRQSRHKVAFNEFGVDILECLSCGHLFSSYERDPHYDGFWGEQIPAGDQFYWSQARARMHRDFVDRFVAQRSGRLLDMGCGLGYFLKVIEPHANWSGYGCEVSQAAVSYARETLGLPNVACAHLEDCDFPRESFDLITIWDVLDHILHPDPVLQRCRALLKDGGVFFLRTPNARVQLFRARMTKRARGMRPDFAYLQARDHMHHYSASTIRALLERNGFANIKFLHLHPIESVKKDKRLIVGAVKNVCFAGVRALASVSGGCLNFDNLFVAAHKA